MQRNGILAGGNFIIDFVKIVDVYPQQDALANILRESSSNGGGAYNVLVDWAQMGATFPLEAIGLVGDDANGQTIFSDLKARNIDTTQLQVTTEAATSYTDAMSVESSGRRTFFHRRGANALLGLQHFDFSRTQTKIFYLAYLLLLDSLDVPDENGLTDAARVLEAAQKAGLKTAIDVVSEDGERFARIVLPTMRFVDYAFLNEFEAGRCTGLSLRIDDKLQHQELEAAARQLLDAGVGEAVIVHFPEGAFAIEKNGATSWQGSVALPAEKIAGATGAGDAFCAGVLLGLHDDVPLQDALKLGVCAAASSLLHPTASLGLMSKEQCLQLGEELGFRDL